MEKQAETTAPPAKRAPTPPNTVLLNIKRAELDKIVFSDKRVEQREASNHNRNLFMVRDEGGANVRQYDYAQLFVERNATPSYALVKLYAVEIFEYLDPDTGAGSGEYYFMLGISEIVEHNLTSPLNTPPA